MSQTLEDLGLPTRLHELTGATWEELNKLADPGGDTPAVHEALDQLREAYVDLYEESAAISRSSVVAAEQRLKRQKGPSARARAARRRPDPARRAGRDPAVGAPRAAQDGGPRAARMTASGSGHPQPRGPHRVRHHLALDAARRPAARRHRRAAGQGRGAAACRGCCRRCCGRATTCWSSTTARPTAPPRWPPRPPRGPGSPTSSARRRTPSRWPAPAPSTSPSPSGRCTRWPTSTTGASPRCGPATRGSGTATWSSPPRARCRSATSAGRSATSSRSSGCPRHGLYLESESKGYLDLGLRNAEEWGFPIGPDFVFTKAFEWEIRTTPDPVRSIGLPHGLCVELKYLDGDEFAHWTDPASFATSYRNKRKRREWTVYNALLEGTVLPGRARDHRARGHAHRRPRHPGVAAARAPAARGRAAGAGPALPGSAGAGAPRARLSGLCRTPFDKAARVQCCGRRAALSGGAESHIWCVGE